MKLKDKIAIITGGGRGIGRAIAIMFANEGARVCICSRNKANLENVAKEIQDKDGQALPLETDISDEGQVEEMINEVISQYGGIDILVNNSGIGGPTAPIHEMNGEEWRKVIDINLNGLFYCTKYVIPTMIDKGSGNIINIGSIGGVNAYPLRTPYNASKAAVASFTRTVAAEVGKYNIRCNCISPGPIAGERFWNVMKARADALGKTFEEMKDWWVDQVPLRRFITAEEVARTALFLVSDDAENITAQQLCVSGGMEVT